MQFGGVVEGRVVGGGEGWDTQRIWDESII
jgi:hypothetical protein